MWRNALRLLIERAMRAFLTRLWLISRSRLRSRARLEAENLVLRRQVLILRRQSLSRVRLGNLDRSNLGLALPNRSRSFECDCGREAEDRNPVAPPRLPNLLALEVSAA